MRNHLIQTKKSKNFDQFHTVLISITQNNYDNFYSEFEDYQDQKLRTVIL